MIKKTILFIAFATMFLKADGLADNKVFRQIPNALKKINPKGSNFSNETHTPFTYFAGIASQTGNPLGIISVHPRPNMTVEPIRTRFQEGRTVSENIELFAKENSKIKIEMRNSLLLISDLNSSPKGAELDKIFIKNLRRSNITIPNAVDLIIKQLPKKTLNYLLIHAGAQQKYVNKKINIDIVNGNLYSILNEIAVKGNVVWTISGTEDFTVLQFHDIE